ncbi:sulfonate ABC transporter substrate-binding protein [Ralstonia insidiosa]|jgi:sulfonate transport system substrate-binding protein|uniref:sulfonate ABC transporter substrate-binding protein n=1 Tax=Ralstonia TaxID=48736 RepID=UPI000664AF0D|nr:sulfonate ABC transporter substrate-binding protein [Ralstonia insidiosa]KMW46696.1 sulfonate ABC transporter substrate-binding protein [Ralstonia sp. MD27]MBX3771330.1 sulfonate ABC transporter substrate-binding protein [Ralstonia pickettii]NOZ19204.1 sulfonate ABC transporter substrate-binding protein [Betaproteobacteria bacterium]MBA9855423.1 sulfonate ABC transporter substrate-binding protein [Ralstonia insidiosa]MBA9869340.1 sulfonate ABC transporter substrate-binding protein [Ralstoni
MQTQSPHTPPSSGRRRWLAALLGAGLALSAGLTQAADPAGTVRIGFQKAGLLAVLKAQGSLDKPLGELGYKVEWKEFPAGPQLLEALNTGSIDFGYTGAPPAVFAQAAGARLVYVGAEPGGKTNEALFVLDGSPAHSVADLKGKRIALQKGSSSHYLLVQLLKRANLTVQDVQPIYLPPAEARAAFESGAVDAWVVWDPYYALAQKALKTRTLGDFSEVPTSNFYEATPEFVKAHPRAVNTILAQLRTSGLWVNQHPQETAALLAPKLGIEQPVVETWLRRVPYGVTPITPEIVASQQQIADLFLQQKLIPKAVNVQSAVWQASFPVAGL